MNQYLRRWGLMIDGEPFIESGTGHQFRCVFDVMVSPQAAQSFADIRIYNLSKGTTIAQGSSISLSAGYNDNFDVIFIGTVTNVLRERDGPSTTTRLVCRSGAPTDDRGSANSSYGSGTLVTDVLKDMARSWPRFLDLDEAQFDDAPTFTSGYIADGDITQILDQLGYQFDFDWMQDRGQLVISRRGRERASGLFEINQYTGMVGVPEVSRGPSGLGVFVTTRINPYIRSTSRINVTSEFSTFNTGNIYVTELLGDASANGEYNVLTMHYSGDTHGDDWNLNIDALRAGIIATSPSTPGGTSTGIPGTAVTDGSLVWGARVDQEFRAKTREVANALDMDPNWLMSIMAWETGNTFNPAERNPGGSATGLIQFIESTARGLGTTTAKLARMTAVEQLDYVQRYFEDYASRINNIGDAYMAVLWPAGMSKPDSYVLWEKTGTYARQYAANAGLDKDRDDKITRGEAVERVNNSYKQGLKYLR